MLKRFNVRVYGLIFNKKEELLVFEESYNGKTIFKFPGGGVELGEGIMDALKRELQEELGIESLIEVSHFYTTEDCVPSAFKPEEQIISVYYKVKTDLDKLEFKPEFIDEEGEVDFHWLTVNTDLLDKIQLPIECKVVAKLLQA